MIWTLPNFIDNKVDFVILGKSIAQGAAKPLAEVYFQSKVIGLGLTFLDLSSLLQYLL